MNIKNKQSGTFTLVIINGKSLKSTSFTEITHLSLYNTYVLKSSYKISKTCIITIDIRTDCVKINVRFIVEISLYPWRNRGLVIRKLMQYVLYILNNYRDSRSVLIHYTRSIFLV